VATKLGPLCRVKLLTEKAGVDGSIPSLATIILKNLAESRLAARFALSPLFFGEIRFGSWLR